jgi:hypothetical protein
VELDAVCRGKQADESGWRERQMSALGLCCNSSCAAAWGWVRIPLESPNE